jgi:hypothetical protein
LRINDLESTWEYYLLENLSLGLVRDELREPSGYKGIILAESWQRLDDKTFEFKLREGIQWSDGSEMTCEQIRDSIIHSINVNSRHLFYLKHLEELECRRNTLVFHMKISIGSEFLGELSSADFSIINTRNLAGDWSLTSGYYFIHFSDPNYELRASSAQNLDWPELCPKSVSLVDPFVSPDPPDLFMRTAGIDIYPVMVGIYQNKYDKILQTEKSKQGASGLIHFLYLSASQTSELRRNGLRKIISKVAVVTNFPPRLSSFGQFIPPGFDGHLEGFKMAQEEITSSELSALKASEIKIDFLQGQNFENFKSQITEACSKGVKKNLVES